MPLLVERPVFTYWISIFRYSLDTIGASSALRTRTSIGNFPLLRAGHPERNDRRFRPCRKGPQRIELPVESPDSFSAGMVDCEGELMLRGNKKGRPISNRQETSARFSATSFPRQASLLPGEPASVPVAPVSAKCPPCRP